MLVHNHHRPDNGEIFDRLVIKFFPNALPYIVALFIFLRLILNLIMNSLGFDDLDFWTIIFWLVIVLWIMFANDLFISNVEVNQTEIYQGRITGTIYSKWPGFNWVSLLQTKIDTKETEKHLDTSGTGDAETSGGAVGGGDNMSFAWKVIYRVNIENDRDENMRKYVLTTDANIASAITLAANMHIIQWLYERTSTNAKLQQKTALTADIFDSVCEEYGIVIISCGLKDLDFSPEIRAARKAEGEMKAFESAIKVLTDAGVDANEALRTVKAHLLKGNYKQIDVTGNGAGNVIVNPN